MTDPLAATEIDKMKQTANLLTPKLVNQEHKC